MIGRLKKRREFLAVAEGPKAARRCFMLERRRREDAGVARFGFTVSKRTAKKAVERNRIRRRLKEAVRLDASRHAQAGHDYVLVGRRFVLSVSFETLRTELSGALRDAHRVDAPKVDAPRVGADRAGSDGGRRPRSSQ
jgi:ribonuclease P protein component